MCSEPATYGNIDKFERLSRHKDAKKRKIAAERLIDISRLDFQTSFAIAQRFVNDVPPMAGHLGAYMRHIADSHPRHALRLCKLVIEERSKSPGVELEDGIVGVAVSTIARKALSGDPEFSRMFDRTVRYASHNCVVGFQTSVFCGKLLHHSNPPDKVLEVFGDLLDSRDPCVLRHAEFFLLYTLESVGSSLFPQIGPVLEKAANIEHDPHVNPHPPALVGYLIKFWKEIPESAVLLDAVCRNNPQTTIWEVDSSAVLDAMDDMFKSSLLDLRSKRMLLGTLMLFVKAEWPQAGQVLETAKRHI